MTSPSPATIAPKMVALSQDSKGVASLATSTLSPEQIDALSRMRVLLLDVQASASSESLLSGEASLFEIVGV